MIEKSERRRTEAAVAQSQAVVSWKRPKELNRMRKKDGYNNDFVCVCVRRSERTSCESVCVCGVYSLRGRRDVRKSVYALREPSGPFRAMYVCVRCRWRARVRACALRTGSLSAENEREPGPHGAWKYGSAWLNKAIKRNRTLKVCCARKVIFKRISIGLFQSLWSHLSQRYPLRTMSKSGW